MENLYNALDDVIKCIMESQEYKNCLQLKQQMEDNNEIKELIDEIKKVQKKYVKSNYDEEVFKELDLLRQKLSEIPIYNIYNNNLTKVNNMINYVKDSLNDYFYNLFNN